MRVWDVQHKIDDTASAMQSLLEMQDADSVHYLTPFWLWWKRPNKQLKQKGPNIPVGPQKMAENEEN
jgi:hypothetical protein